MAGAIAFCYGGQLKPGIHLDSGTAEMLDSPDMDFVMGCAQQGAAQIQAGHWAAARASDPAVKNLGKQLAGEYLQSHRQLDVIAQARRVTLPNSPTSQDTRQYGKLQNLSGPALDKAYLSSTLKSEQAQIKKFKKEAKSGKDPEIQAYAAQTLPNLQRTCEKVKLLRSKIAS